MYLGGKKEQNFTDKISLNLKGFCSPCFLFRAKYITLFFYSFDQSQWEF